jgi:hypothetical protein
MILTVGLLIILGATAWTAPYGKNAKFSITVIYI